MSSLALMTGLCLVPALAIAAEPTLPTFDAAQFAQSVPNDFFPLQVGSVHRLTGTILADDGSRLPFLRVRSVPGLGPVILGVQTTILLDEEYQDGRIVERSSDYHATDASGTVWYFGEAVSEFSYDDAGALTDTHPGKSWVAGVDGALPGIVLTQGPMPEVEVFMAHAPAAGEMEFSKGVDDGMVITVPAGTFPDTVKILTQSTTDPDLREFTWWAKGMGLIRVEEDLSPAFDAPKVVVELAE